MSPIVVWGHVFYKTSNPPAAGPAWTQASASPSGGLLPKAHLNKNGAGGVCPRRRCSLFFRFYAHISSLLTEKT